MSVISKPIHPNVPLAQGVPTIARLQSSINKIQLLATDLYKTYESLFGERQWDLVDGTLQSVFSADIDSVISVDFRRDFNLADYIIENGGFKSYDKVELPFEAKLTVAFSSNILQLDKIDNALKSIDESSRSLQLYSIKTPNGFIQNLNITHYDYTRSANTSSTMLTVNIYLKEVRIAPSPQFTSVKSDSAADPKSIGQVKPDEVTTPKSLDTKPVT